MHFKMESYLLFTNTSPQECSQKGFTLPQAAQFHLSGGIDKTQPLSQAKLLLLVVTAEDNNVHYIYRNACFSAFGITKCAKASSLFILFHLFVPLHIHSPAHCASPHGWMPCFCMWTTALTNCLCVKCCLCCVTCTVCHALRPVCVFLCQCMCETDSEFH